MCLEGQGRQDSNLQPPVLEWETRGVYPLGFGYFKPFR